MHLKSRVWLSLVKATHDLEAKCPVTIGAPIHIHNLGKCKLCFVLHESDLHISSIWIHHLEKLPSIDPPRLYIRLRILGTECMEPCGIIRNVDDVFNNRFHALHVFGVYTFRQIFMQFIRIFDRRGAETEMLADHREKLIVHPMGVTNGKKHDLRLIEKAITNEYRDTQGHREILIVGSGVHDQK